MQATTVEVLVTKAKFDPQIAVAVAEAIDMAINSAQLITVPVLDARLAALEARLDARFAGIDERFKTFEAQVGEKLSVFKSEIIRWVFLVMLGNVALSTGAQALLNTLQR
ncbi:MAG: hypothetical protein U1F35_20790 [Steroidobacteraceae bacterium]